MRDLTHLTISPQGLAFNPATGHSFMLNPSGTFILKALQAGHAPHQVVDLLAHEYSLRPDDADRDVSDFISRLRTFGLM